MRSFMVWYRVRDIDGGTRETQLGVTADSEGDAIAKVYEYAFSHGEEIVSIIRVQG